MRTPTALILTAALASACTLAPRYEQPKAPVPPAWHRNSNATADPATAAEVGWRDFFPDERVQKLIDLALANNRNLRVAALNVRAAEAQYRIQRGNLFPAIDAVGAAQIQKIPAGVVQSSLGGAGSSSGGGINIGDDSVITRSYTAGIGFTAYELDFFGGIRSLDHAALEQYLGYEETRRGAQISLIAEVVNAYLMIAADRAILKITQDTLEAQSRSNDLIRRSLDAGTTTALALSQSDITVDTARADLATYTRQLAQDRNALVVLLGAELPADFEFADDLASTGQNTELPVGLPSEVLTRRPDILAAEHQLKAANADIGAARAAFFPRISLTGNYGFASAQLSDLFKHSSEAWSFSPQISVPIFNAGANRANLDLAKIQKNVYVAQYEKAIQSAFREVDDALAARGTLEEQIGAQRALLDATTSAYRLADMRFKAGVDSFLTVLDAQRSLYSAQQALVGLELQRLENMATLYKALGGGLQEHSGSH